MVKRLYRTTRSSILILYITQINLTLRPPVEHPPSMSTPLRIGIDARPLAFPGTGNARYLHLMLKQLIKIRPDDDWVLFSHRAVHNEYFDLLNAENVLLNINQSVFKPGPVWVHLQLIKMLKEYGCDLLWASLPMLPLFYRKRITIPAMVNFHDLNAFIVPQTMVRWVKWQQRLLSGHILKNADRILCLSKNTKDDIIAHFPKYKEENLMVIYPGCELPSIDEKPPLNSAQFSSFILSVGSIEPRKNLDMLLKAYLNARKGCADLLPLVIVGKRGWGDDSLYNQLSSRELESSGIYYIENANDAELRWCYNHCAFLAFPSLHEGFGLPVIEALQLKKPALLSDISILKEIAPGCTFIEPRNADAWRNELIQFNTLYKEGRLTAPEIDNEFWSWNSRAQVLSDLIEEIMLKLPSNNR